MIIIASNVDIYFLSDDRIVFHKMNFNNQKIEIVEIDGDDKGI